MRKVFVSVLVIVATLVLVPSVLAALTSPSAFGAPFKRGNLVTRGWASPQAIDAQTTANRRSGHAVAHDRESRLSPGHLPAEGTRRRRPPLRRPALRRRNAPLGRGNDFQRADHTPGAIRSGAVRSRTAGNASTQRDVDFHGHRQRRQRPAGTQRLGRVHLDRHSGLNNRRRGLGRLRA